PIEIQDFIGPDVLEGDWQDRTARARGLLSGHEGPVGIHGPFKDIPLDAQDPGAVALVRRRLLQGLEAAAALDARWMVIHSPFTTWDSYNMGMIPGSLPRRAEDICEVIEPAVRRAEEIGCVLMMENIEDREPQQRRAVVEMMASEALALSIDTGHAFYAHRATGAPPVDYFAIDAGKRLGHVHLQDADGWADRHWTLGQGEIAWNAFFHALHETDAHPHLIIELRDARGIEASWSFLKDAGLGA
ncbi:MAG: sugar phosphate isomerase/epimerase family protein, partial [Rubricella sp.]